jgi:hypothetical protein
VKSKTQSKPLSPPPCLSGSANALVRMAARGTTNPQPRTSFVEKTPATHLPSTDSPARTRPSRPPCPS